MHLLQFLTFHGLSKWSVNHYIFRRLFNDENNQELLPHKVYLSYSGVFDCISQTLLSIWNFFRHMYNHLNHHMIEILYVGDVMTAEQSPLA